jgi:hypothetical protein
MSVASSSVRKSLRVAVAAIGIGAVVSLIALPSAVSFARRSVRSATVGDAPAPREAARPVVAPRAVRAPRPAVRPSAPPAAHPFGGVPCATGGERRPDGHVEGAILDEGGEPLLGASIAAIPVGGGDAVYVDADAAGRFSLRLPPGTYTFSVYSNGDVAPEVIESLPVDAGEQLRGLVVQLPAGAFARDADACDDACTDACDDACLDDRAFDPDHHFDDDDDGADPDLAPEERAVALDRSR